ncbi:MAG TPA: DUF5995 family protein [Ilumatobacteraceae bacterium]|nr:DUF5995 family protein [Ilumatobacteraceae bacterium]
MTGSIETIDEAIAAMDGEIDRCLECDDLGGYFTVVYRAVTARVRDGIEAGEFADCEQMERFDVLFARRYLDARANWRTGETVPRAWRTAFETAESGRCLIAQHLLLGINAHINLDLGLAAAAATDPGEVEALRDDFETINDVLAELVDHMQRSLAAVSPWTRYVDIAGLRFDEALVTFSIRQARLDAWDFATTLSLASPDEQRWLEHRRDADVAALGARIARPGRPLRWLVGAAHRRERHDLQRAIAALEPS